MSSLVGLAIAEGALRAAGRPGSPERPGAVPDYGDVIRAEGMGPGGLLKEGFEGRLTDGLGGTIYWKNDAQGFRRTADVADRPAPGVVRVLSMGDSFVAGYRVDQDATYSRRLEKDLLGRGVAVEVLVSEVEEPVNGLYWLQTAAARFRPAVVLLGVTLGNDIAQAGFALDEPGSFRLQRDPVRVERLAHPVPLANRPELALALPPACVRGGVAALPRRRAWRLDELLRGLPPQPIASARGPGLTRFLFDGVNGLGMSLVSPPAAVETAFEKLERSLRAYRDLGAERGFSFAVLLFPQRDAVQPEDWNATVEGYGLVRECFDPGLPGRRVRAFCAAQGIPCLDPSQALAEEHRRTGRSLYLPGGDMHLGAAGHRTVFEAVRQPVASLVQGKIPSSM